MSGVGWGRRTSSSRLSRKICYRNRRRKGRRGGSGLCRNVSEETAKLFRVPAAGSQHISWVEEQDASLLTIGQYCWLYHRPLGLLGGSLEVWRLVRSSVCVCRGGLKFVWRRSARSQLETARIQSRSTGGNRSSEKVKTLCCIISRYPHHVAPPPGIVIIAGSWRCRQPRALPYGPCCPPWQSVS